MYFGKKRSVNLVKVTDKAGMDRVAENVKRY